MDGYTKYLEARLALAEEALRGTGRAISMPEAPWVRDLNGLPIGSVIRWARRYPRGDVYNFVAFLQKTNEWHMVSGKSKHIKTHAELATDYLEHSIDNRVYLTYSAQRLVR